MPTLLSPEPGLGRLDGLVGRTLGSWGPALQTSLCFPGIGLSIGGSIYTQLRSTVYEALASVQSLGQGKWNQCSGLSPGDRPQILLPAQQAPPMTLPELSSRKPAG